LLTFRNLVVPGIGKHRSGKHAGRDESRSARRYQGPHNKRIYTREGAIRKLRKSERGNGFCHCPFAH
jgi:hypothetical protein